MMLGVVYLLICLFFGVQLMRVLFPDPQRLFVGVAPKKSSLSLVPLSFFYFPAGFITGLVLVTFVTYWLGLLMAPFLPTDLPALYPANIVSLCMAIYLGSLFWQKAYNRRHPPVPEPAAGEVPERRRLGHSHKAKDSVTKRGKAGPFAEGFRATGGSVFFYVFSVLLLTAAAAGLFYYSFHVSGGNICSGYSVFSDLSPHTAVLSSFSNGANFPTEYPHFPGDGIRYHFLFYFLCGNLNLLGFRIDHALNVPSVLVMVCCFLLLGTLAVLLSGRRGTFLLSPVLVLFRSSWAVVSQVRELTAVPGATISSVIKGILGNMEWIGSTPYDNWGLWAVNVYANQRHLLLGASMLIILLFLFLPHVRRMFLHIRKAKGFKAKIKHFLFCREAWIPRRKDPVRPYALGFLAILIVGVMPYFHGSALVAAMIILCALAVFSENRLTYLVVALAAVGSSLLQTQYFSGGASNVVSLAYYFGFVVENPSVLNVALYIAKVTGVACVLLAILLFTQRSAYRTVALIAFALPAVFAFFFTMTIDVTANHKFIQISLILFSVYLAMLLAVLWHPFARKESAAAVAAPDDASTDAADPAAPRAVHPAARRIGRGFALFGTRVLAIVLFAALTASGVSEWIVYYNLNKNTVQMDLRSDMVGWIEENTAPNAVFLTAPYAMNAFFLSGRYAYYGHPYYAWSAGYDTEARLAVYTQLLTGCDGDLQAFLALCRQEGISYVLVDNELRNQSDYDFDETFFSDNFAVASYFPNENDTVIYKVS